MKTEVHITPENEEEVELLEELVKVRNYAVEETDLEREAVAGVFAQMAAGLAGEEGGMHGQPDAMFECPECGRPAQDASSGELGGSPRVEPCGCQTVWEALPADLFDEE